MSYPLVIMGTVDDDGLDVAVPELMCRLAGGDGSAAFELAERCGVPLAAEVRRACRRRGIHRLPEDELTALLLDAAMALADCAAGWRPDRGAMPWRWASARIANAVDRHLGVFTLPLDEHALARLPAEAAQPAAGSEPPAAEVLAERSGYDERCRLVRDALRRVASPRDQAVFLEVVVQDSLGDRSPAVTVGATYGMRPDAVRQQHRRIRRRLRHLVAHEVEFAPLAGLPVVA